MIKFDHSYSRVEGFSDAVFAFAATLLVVSLEVPDSFGVLEGQLKGFLSFGLTFLALLLIWKAHYNFFRRIQNLDNVLIALNCCLLFVVLYFVYPLKFLSNIWFSKVAILPSELTSLFSYYSLGFGLIFLFIALMYFWASKIHESQERISELKFYKRHFFIFVMVAILSIILSQLQIGLSFGFPGFVYAFLGPLCYWHGKRYLPN